MGSVIQVDLSKSVSPNEWGVVSRWTKFARSVLVRECLSTSGAKRIVTQSSAGLWDDVDWHRSLIQQCCPGALWQVCHSNNPVEMCSRGTLELQVAPVQYVQCFWASPHLLHTCWRVPRYLTQPGLLGSVGQSDWVCKCCTDTYTQNQRKFSSVDIHP